MSEPDLWMIAGFFTGKVIIVAGGKITILGAWVQVLFCEGVGVRFPHGNRLCNSPKDD